MKLLRNYLGKLSLADNLETVDYDTDIYKLYFECYWTVFSLISRSRPSKFDVFLIGSSSSEIILSAFYSYSDFNPFKTSYYLVSTFLKYYSNLVFISSKSSSLFS